MISLIYRAAIHTIQLDFMATPRTQPLDNANIAILAQGILKLLHPLANEAYWYALSTSLWLSIALYWLLVK